MGPVAMLFEHIYGFLAETNNLQMNPPLGTASRLWLDDLSVLIGL